ncbi:phosphatidylserine decarboxylase [Enterobacteriaceae endosymbiont of Donacia cincticornis]|uniref:archaetidylserine decarboxylase n=1 Tax=Enterobacteriaceae endosymbiont of Donacia cincticornis TaxID=2675773 RepID=UPI001449F36C|nr:archaetidylserine decarboxylase [Enterobacteriaceae endosymbiont of Donacia cincticornis]QJC36063.1 phosphatidylserine decarboxylase [Enterobacteriaceae endosymbiont of Donacia cincticornis]
MKKKIYLYIQRFLPKLFVTNIFGYLSKKKLNIITTFFIFLFIKFYKINMKETKYPNIFYYKTFNKFFIRKLNMFNRPIDNNKNHIIHNSDGIINEIGFIKKNKLFQFKGCKYSLYNLIGYNKYINKIFTNGNFINVYLSPKNYHRVHMSYNGILLKMIYIPGKLFPVNNIITNNLCNLFVLNERVVFLFKTKFGFMIKILIGAQIVGSIHTSWYGSIVPPRKNKILTWNWPYINNFNKKDFIFLKKGEEMGYFDIGSTVITLFPPKTIKFNPILKKGFKIKVGELLASF